MVTPMGSTFDGLQPGTVKQMKREDIPLTKSITAMDPGLVTSLKMEIDLIRSQIEQATVPSVVNGIRATGVESGFGQNSLVAQARVRFGPIAAALESLLEEFLSDFLRCVQFEVGEPVPIWGPTSKGMVDQILDPADIDDYIYPIVTVNPKLPTDRANEVAIGTGLLQLGAIDLDTFIEDYAGYENPEEMRIKVMRDRAVASQPIQNLLNIAAIHESGMIDWLTEKLAPLGIPPAAILQAIGAFTNPGGQTLNGGGGGPIQANTAAMSGGGILASGPNRTVNATAKDQPQPGAPLTSPSQSAVAAGVPPVRG